MNTGSFFFSRLVDSRSYVEEVEQANRIQRYMYLQHSSSLIGAVMIIIQPFFFFQTLEYLSLSPPI